MTPAWRRNDSGGSTPTQGTVTAVAGWRPAKPLGPRRERTTEHSKVVRALETKFLLFETRQEQDSVLWCCAGVVRRTRDREEANRTGTPATAGSKKHREGAKPVPTVAEPPWRWQPLVPSTRNRAASHADGLPQDCFEFLSSEVELPPSPDPMTVLSWWPAKVFR